MSMAVNRYNELKELIEGLQKDFEKFYEKEVDAAGTRIRKGMLELRQLAATIRKEVIEIRNQRKAGKNNDKKTTKKKK